jgi:uncharacterized protein YcnI
MHSRSAALAVAVVLALPAVAQAHVSLHPNTVPAGSFPTLDIRVPSEEKTANTTRIEVLFPPGFISVVPETLPGWKTRTITRKLATPVKTDEGTVTEEAAEIIWTGDGKLGKIPPETFVDLPISTTIPDADRGKTLPFKTVQRYDNGKTVRWIGTPDADQPAPTINVTAEGGVLEDVAGTEAGPGKVQPAAATTTPSTTKPTESKGASKGLAIAALVVGIGGVLVGTTALVTAGRRRPA